MAKRVKEEDSDVTVRRVQNERMYEFRDQLKILTKKDLLKLLVANKQNTPDDKEKVSRRHSYTQPSLIIENMIIGTYMIVILYVYYYFQDTRLSL